jgi:hypothetical protein
MTWIHDFAKIASWDDRLRSLAAIAEPERWDYRCVPTKKTLPILRSYIEHTFARASEQQKLVEADRSACFNTGLLTAGQEEIFGIFTVSETYDKTQPPSPSNQKWWLKSWARSGEYSLTDFMELPPLAEYWSDPSLLLFDPKLQIQLNLDHIVRDNLNRFPEELGGCVDKNGVPSDLADDEGDSDEAESGDDSAAVPIATRNALEGAVKHSIRLAQRSYRMAVPQFHHGKVQLLLPIYLRDTKRPDLALTLERNGGWYRAATVLYPDWAYRHARLLARPNSEWLGGFRDGIEP